MGRFVCIHGHFYQPPRENPWLDAIEVQDSAAPYHDWNARIQAECYAPNAASRIRRDFSGPVVGIVNNYREISFNFGPTLLSWMERADPEAYAQIQLADRLSAERRDGHGNALAQVYNHVIMPLASDRDRRTQVLWGLGDFVHRFSRRPEGMWLPETGVDRASLAALVDAGILFTVLSPFQAARVRRRTPGENGAGVSTGTAAGTASGPAAAATGTAGPGARKGRRPARRAGGPAWEEVQGGRIDPTRPYWYDLGDGRGIALFFYDGPLSSAIAFQGLLNDGRGFGMRLLGGFRERTGEQLVHVATDGESYGHHHRHGDMALAAALQTIQQAPGVELTNYAQHLARFPPEWEVELIEPSAWSCAHGVGRWSRDCGCGAGTAGYHHRWREPLRHALDYLKEGVDRVFETEGARVLTDPWGARDGYVWVLLDPSDAGRSEFLMEHARGDLQASEASVAWRLLEMQRNAMLMYTSCGWFFDEISGIEGVQVLRYAARAAQLAESFGASLEPGFRERLAEAPSNLAVHGDGRRVYEKLVLPSRADPDRILSAHAIASLLDPPAPRSRLYCYRIRQADHATGTRGNATVAVGRLHLVDETTLEEDWASYAVLHFGGHDFACKVHRFASISAYEQARDKVLQAFRSHSTRDAVLAIEAGFPGPGHDIRDVFLDDRRRLLRSVLEDSLERLASSYQRVFRENRGLMEFLAEIETPVPEEFAAAAGFVLESGLRARARALRDPAVRDDAFREAALGTQETLDEARRLRLPLETRELAEALEHRLEAETSTLVGGLDQGALDRAVALLELVQRNRLEVSLWRSENAVFRFLGGPYREIVAMVRFGQPEAEELAAAAARLAAGLGFELP